ncbi:nse4 [Cystoisospora suis]|uniref:Nse4 n=1 Tax=Cystoisospora suis TaxID=483139 RepID=A0A2C6KU87_9APIC|nr:nse4 [Cystoisospora suis]
MEEEEDSSWKTGPCSHSASQRQHARSSFFLRNMANDLEDAVKRAQAPSSPSQIDSIMRVDDGLIRRVASTDTQGVKSVCKTGNCIAGLVRANAVHMNKEKQEEQLAVLLDKWKSCDASSERRDGPLRGLCFVSLSRMSPRSLYACHSLHYGGCLLHSLLRGDRTEGAPKRRKYPVRGQRSRPAEEDATSTEIGASPDDCMRAAETLEIKNEIYRTLVAVNRIQQLSAETRGGSASAGGGSPSSCGANSSQASFRESDDVEDNNGARPRNGRAGADDVGWVDVWQLVTDPRGIEGFNRTCLNLFALTLLVRENRVAIKQRVDNGASPKRSSACYLAKVVVDDEREENLDSSCPRAPVSNVSPPPVAGHLSIPRTASPANCQALVSPWTLGLWQEVCRSMSLTTFDNPLVDSQAVLERLRNREARVVEKSAPRPEANPTASETLACLDGNVSGRSATDKKRQRASCERTGTRAT